MNKSIHPGVFIAAIVIILVIAGVLIYRATSPPPTQGMNPLGPGAAMLRKSGNDMSKYMTPAEKAMMRGHNVNPGPGR
ncbi:MAG TPA: hypothetical protein VFA07_06690 [Chthonomonadaceae bacterium]|nr:hypothetical protein [Chthonomonadaceae bacterium]